MRGVHVHSSEGFDLVRTLLLLEVAHWRRIPTVVTVHGAEFMKEVGRAPRLVRAIFKRAGAVTVLSEEVRAAARVLGAQRLSILPNPVRLQSPAEGVAERKQILFAGEIGYRKGVDVLLKAWPAVRDAHPDVSLLLIGPVTERAVVGALPAGVTFGGALPNTAVIEALAVSAVAVLPSRAEAMPVFVLEAMAAGVPVVATPVGAVETTLGGAGVVVPVNDVAALAAAIVALLDDPGRMVEASRVGQSLVEQRYSTEVFVRNVVALYGSVFSH
jgi:glycosyltransferase involved in cell wall biosynthesis